MTREETIATLKANYPDACFEQLRDAVDTAISVLKQPEIVRCKDCKHWTQTVGKMKGCGLGRCDFHDVNLVNCNGFCYWAERRTDE